MNATALTAVWDPRFEAYDLGADHPFSERSRGLAADLLATAMVAREAERGPIDWLRQVDPATREGLLGFHRPEYLDFVERASGLGSPILLDAGDTPSFPGCYEEAARIVAGAERALERTLANGRPSFHPAGGLHHAHADRASGFCIFNDVAVAVGRAVRDGRRVAYVDIDAHHGDGVMYGFYESGRVLDIDFHQDGRTLFPGTGFPSETGRADGAGFKVNLPLPPLSGDEALLPLFRRLVPRLLRSFRPELIVLQHGVDGHAGDALAHLQYTPAAYAEIDRTVLGLAHELAGGHLVVTGGGGYRARSVSRVLATTGLILAGGSAPEAHAALPESWRERYRATIGELAPKTWVDPEEPTGSRWRPEHETKLVGELEQALGQTFPRVSPT
ncbi:MAG: acetoin utilization protein AcuC [Thermoplasmata archaeon]